MKTKRNLIQICLAAAALLLSAGLEAKGATVVVTNTADGGTGSLRQLIASAAPGDTITFATNLSGTTLTLFGQLLLNKSVTIDASALPGGVQITGNGHARIFFVAGSASVVLTSLTLTNGNDQNDSAGGGGIYNQATLTVNQCTLTGNHADFNSGGNGGGGIFNSGTLTVNESTLTGNSAGNGGGGGAIFNSGTLTVNQSTLTANSADSGSGGGGIYNYSGTVSIFNSIVAGNSALNGSGADVLNFSDSANLNGVNIIQDFNGPASGFAGLNQSPQLAPLGNYGGPTPTMPPLPGSPARHGCFNSANFTTDQRGVPRFLGGITDIGAINLAPPAVATLPATAVLTSNATLNASVNPNAQATTVWFLWGLTNNPYSNQTTPVVVAGGNTNTALAFSNNLTGLTPGIVYHYSALASNADGFTGGGDMLFGSAPVVTLFGSATMTNECHTLFADPGAINAAHLPVTLTGNVSTNPPGTYLLTYTASNSLGATGSATRTVTVVDTTAPALTILGANPLYVPVNTPFVDPGVTALDACGGTFAVTSNSTVNLAVPGFYIITYSTTDSFSNTATAIRLVVARARQIVTTASDSGAGSLRQVISNSISGDYVQFAPNLSGATILLTSGQLTLSSNLTIDASALAGGIEINGNTSSRIFNVASNTTLVLASLVITNGSQAPGSGIFNSGTLTLKNCTLTGNGPNALGFAGGIYNYLGASLTVNQSTLTGNYADSGGGIYNYGVLTVNDSTLAGNHADLGGGGSGGGGIYNSGTLTVNRSTLTGNHADKASFGGGGGIYNNIGATSTVNQSTIVANHADNNASGGGGIFNHGLLTVNQCTLTGNHADNGIGGGGIDNITTMSLSNSIVAGNSATNTSGSDIFTASTVTLGGANIVQDFKGPGALSGSAPITNAPLLAPLGNYGGPTQTAPPLPGSPAIDAGSDSATNLFATDQRGDPRLTGLHVDIGAVEFTPFSTLVTTAADDGDGSLRRTILVAANAATITFAPNLSGATILLTSGQLTLSRNLTIDASSLPGGITINGNQQSRIFMTAFGNTNVLTALTITNGADFEGGGIYNFATLMLNQCTLTGNTANNIASDGTRTGSNGGGIYNNSIATLTLNQCTLTGNTANIITFPYNNSGSGGGGIFNGGVLAVNQSAITGNHADNNHHNKLDSGGGGIFNEFSGNLTVNQSTLTGNHADNDDSEVGLCGGGGILNRGALMVNQSTLTGNSVHDDNVIGFGGGILNFSIHVTTLFNSIVAGNLTVSGAGADIFINSNAASVIILSGTNIVQDYFGPLSGPAPINANPLLALPGNYGGPTQTVPPLPGSPAIDAGSDSATNTFAVDQRNLPRLVGLHVDIGAVEGTYTTNGPGSLTGMTRLGNGSTKFTFTNYTDTSSTVLASTNVALPGSAWSNLGPATESPIGSGHFQFTDLQATNNKQRFYRVSTP